MFGSKMSLQLRLRCSPQRAILLAAETHALIFRQSNSTSVTEVSAPSQSPPRNKCIVEFTSLSAINLEDFPILPTSVVQGTLGLFNIKNDVYLCVISGAVRVATVRPGETVQRILSVEFFCLNRDDFDHELQGEINSYSAEDMPTNSYDFRDSVPDHPCQELKKILGSGTFYYSVNFDLTNRLQNRSLGGSAFDIDSLDEGFLWNSYMINPLTNFRSRLGEQERKALDQTRILTFAIRGFVLTVTVPADLSPIRGIRSHLPSTLTLISRLSCRRAGTRFNSRGIDDDGNVANFVETETVYWHPANLCFSYAQVRGSVPMFWEQAPGIIPGQQKIQITRSQEATQPAFDKHFEYLVLNYGTVHILNLLSESKPGEVELTTRYEHHVALSPVIQAAELEGPAGQQLLQYSQFDFHAETKGPSGYEAAIRVKQLIHQCAKEFAYFLCDEAESRILPQGPDRGVVTTGPNVISDQVGVFRTNCLDCLDRTNLIQNIISQMALESFYDHRNGHASSDFWRWHSSVWADNGDALSKIYAGTGALKSSFTRHGKMSLAGAIADARKSAARIYINNFADKGRQNTIDMLLGRLVDQLPVHLYDPINDYVAAELKRRISEYTTTDDIRIYVGTFNVNGCKGDRLEDLSAWLCPELGLPQQNPEIVAVGLQEMVELSPQQIMSTDPEIMSTYPVERQAWEKAVGTTLNENARKNSSEEYVLLRSGQLVGAALMIFVKSGVLKLIKNVEGSVKKTGLSGIAGNKGAVAVRFDFANTPMCFLTAHLAAGFANYEERNRNYHTISHGLRFQRNRYIKDHDTIIWLGDFNYRIGLSDEKVRRLASAGDLEALYRNDQLNLQMVAGQAFKHYSEARITFMPTYKYMNGTDNYDTSDKSRIPAWCDRVLRKGNNLRQIHYATAPLRFSDHRPVYATFQCTISHINNSLKENLVHVLYKQRKQDIEKAVGGGGVDDEDLIEFMPIAPGLPPASSDRHKWWLDSGLPAQSEVRQPRKGLELNTLRDSNPFTPSSEPDWVMPTKSYVPQRLMNQKYEAGTVKSDNYDVATEPRKSTVSEGVHGSSRSLLNVQEQHIKTHNPAISAPSTSSSTKARAPAPPRKPIEFVVSKERNLDLSCSDKRGSPAALSVQPHVIRSTSINLSSINALPQSDEPLPATRQRLIPCLPTTNDVPPTNDVPLSDQKQASPIVVLLKRPAQASSGSSQLLDDDNIGAQHIPSLQPIRRT